MKMPVGSGYMLCIREKRAPPDTKHPSHRRQQASVMANSAPGHPDVSPRCNSRLALEAGASTHPQDGPDGWSHFPDMLVDALAADRGGAFFINQPLI
jgi:hypothetical protein